MLSASEARPSVGDVAEVPWELEERQGVVRDVNVELGRITVELRLQGRPELFSLPVSTASRVGGTTEEAARPERWSWAGGIDDTTVLKTVLDGVGAEREVSVHLTPTRDEDDEPLLFVDVVLLDAEDQGLSPEELLALQTSVRDRVFAAVKEVAVVIVQILPREASAA